MHSFCICLFYRFSFILLFFYTLSTLSLTLWRWRLGSRVVSDVCADWNRRQQGRRAKWWKRRRSELFCLRCVCGSVLLTNSKHRRSSWGIRLCWHFVPTHLAFHLIFSGQIQKISKMSMELVARRHIFSCTLAAKSLGTMKPFLKALHSIREQVVSSCISCLSSRYMHSVQGVS